jgi:glycosyltransferase involved in cell wall biosynthesis
MIRVGYIAGEPNPSRAPHLDRIAAHPDIELTVIYAASTVHRREWDLAFEHEPIVLRGPVVPLTRLLHHDYPLTPQIWGLLNRERFDVLVIGGWSLLATQLAIVWARAHHVPYLVISENHFRENRPAWISLVKSLVLRHVIPQASGHLVTGALAREHALHYGADPELITVFPNTVDIEVYRATAGRLAARKAEIRSKLGIAPDAAAVLQVSRLIPQKGPDELVEAFARASTLTAAPLHLILVGSGEMQAALEQRVGELGLQATFTGFLQGDALLECYAAADVFALFSRREPWGIVVNEAAAFGLPLVLTEGVGAAGDLLRPGKNGELVRSDDPEVQARALARLAADPRLRLAYGRRSIELVEPWGYEPSVSTFASAVRRAYDRGRATPSRIDSSRSA